MFPVFILAAINQSRNYAIVMLGRLAVDEAPSSLTHIGMQIECGGLER
jgi:hypothetical protein